VPGFSIVFDGVSHDYEETEESGRVHALDEVSLSIEGGAFAVLMGPSGSGKSTLLNLAGAVDRPSAGRLLLGPHETSTLNESQLSALRRDHIGFVFQFFNLIPGLSVRENVAFPLMIAPGRRAGIDERVMDVLESVGLSDRAGHMPYQLSGGEMQRAAIARAIVHRPSIILADEPTGNLDSRTGEVILELLRSIHRSERPTVVMATHSEHAASFGDYVVEVVDGRVSQPATG
jgi:putative ABC transport system ATP-binding protein